MGSRDDNGMPQQPLLSSLVIRPSNTNPDFVPPEVHRLPFSDSPGYRNRSESRSPIRRRNTDNHSCTDYGHLRRNHGFGNERDYNRNRDYSSPYGRGRGTQQSHVRDFHGPRFGRGGGIGRIAPNVRPREGDWMCPDSSCGNLNFARREHCNKCNRPRFGHAGSPIRRFYSTPPLNRSINGYRSPPRNWGRDMPDPRENGLIHPRNEGRFSEYQIRGPHPGYIIHERHSQRGFNEKRSQSPPPILNCRGRWTVGAGQRSRSPIIGVPHREMYSGGARNVQRGAY